MELIAAVEASCARNERESLKIDDEGGNALYTLQNISKPLFGLCGLQMGLISLQVAEDQVNAPSMRARRWHLLFHVSL